MLSFEYWNIKIKSWIKRNQRCVSVKIEYIFCINVFSFQNTFKVWGTMCGKQQLFIVSGSRLKAQWTSLERSLTSPSATRPSAQRILRDRDISRWRISLHLARLTRSSMSEVPASSVDLLIERLQRCLNDRVRRKAIKTCCTNKWTLEPKQTTKKVSFYDVACGLETCFMTRMTLMLDCDMLRKWKHWWSLCTCRVKNCLIILRAVHCARSSVV